MECNRYSARSVAMPLIGTGKHKFPEDVVLRVMREEFENFSSMYPRGTLKEVKLVRYDQGIRRKTVHTQAAKCKFKTTPCCWSFFHCEQSKKQLFCSRFSGKTRENTVSKPYFSNVGK